MKKRMREALLATGLTACGASAPPPAVTVTEIEDVHRPSWLQSLQSEMAAIRDCLEARDEPAYAVYVYKLPNLEVGVTTVSRAGVSVQCAWDSETQEVTAQHNADISGGELSKQPMFALGEHPPLVPDGAQLEPVRDGDETLGWVFWLPL